MAVITRAQKRQQHPLKDLGSEIGVNIRKLQKWLNSDSIKTALERWLEDADMQIYRGKSHGDHSNFIHRVFRYWCDQCHGDFKRHSGRDSFIPISDLEGFELRAVHKSAFLASYLHSQLIFLQDPQKPLRADDFTTSTNLLGAILGEMDTSGEQRVAQQLFVSDEAEAEPLEVESDVSPERKLKRKRHVIESEDEDVDSPISGFRDHSDERFDPKPHEDDSLFVRDDDAYSMKDFIVDDEEMANAEDDGYVQWKVLDKERKKKPKRKQQNSDSVRHKQRKRLNGPLQKSYGMFPAPQPRHEIGKATKQSQRKILIENHDKQDDDESLFVAPSNIARAEDTLPTPRVDNTSNPPESSSPAQKSTTIQEKTSQASPSEPVATNSLINTPSDSQVISSGPAAVGSSDEDFLVTYWKNKATAAQEESAKNFVKLQQANGFADQTERALSMVKRENEKLKMDISNAGASKDDYIRKLRQDLDAANKRIANLGSELERVRAKKDDWQKIEEKAKELAQLAQRLQEE
ncbi:MAG: hypothetical protein M1820_005072 [Bogoriella megaspora]|nr:MAG: hypothetical protein M1820_005072 [Bogoriella megaspora]